MSNWVRPSKVRLSEHFLLSDFMGCDSVYRHGYPNVLTEDQQSHLDEAEILAEVLLERVLAETTLSITYGYISPDLSRRIVKYQNPDKPSYHRWDDGAACDILPHCHVQSDGEDSAPVFLAHRIDTLYPVSRTITYSESPIICVATKRAEVATGTPRKALYENRYMGQMKPMFVRYSDSAAARFRQKQHLELEHPWRGAGYPTYHAGGYRAFEHIRTSRHTVMSDFLYSDIAVREGFRNAPPLRAVGKFRKAGRVYDLLIEALGVRRLSIVKGWESPEWSDSPDAGWVNAVSFSFYGPESIDGADAARVALTLPGVSAVAGGAGKPITVVLS